MSYFVEEHASPVVPVLQVLLSSRCHFLRFRCYFAQGWQVEEALAESNSIIGRVGKGLYLLLGVTDRSFPRGTFLRITAPVSWITAALSRFTVAATDLSVL